MVTLVRAHFVDNRRAILLLPALEQSSSFLGHWRVVDGPSLFSPTKVSTRLYSFLHVALAPFLRRIKREGAVLSLGLPYFHYLTGKTFPHFACGYDLRVLWTYDVWEPDMDAFCELVQRARIDILLVSSFQAAQHLRTHLKTCDVHWFPEFINAEAYDCSKPWEQRTIDVLSFGRAYRPYHQAIQRGCSELGINYVFDQDFPTWDALAAALAEAKLCMCFPRSTTNPESSGSFSTMTFRYLQAMASGCLPIGNAPLDAKEIFDYPATVDVEWNDPVGQIKRMIDNPDLSRAIREKNLAAVNGPLHVRAFVGKINEVVAKKL